MEEFVLITGGTSGIGLALAEKMASQGKSLVLVARNSSRLEEVSRSLKERFPSRVETIPQDLSQEASAEGIFTTLEDRGISLWGLINCAGFNEVGHFNQTDPLREQRMLRVLLETPVKLCKEFLRRVESGSKGMILNVCSTGSFFPTPNNAVYCAAKGFLYQFTMAIRHELRKSSIRISALCPGGTKTNFLEEAKITNRRLFHIFPMSAERVADITLGALGRNRGTIVPGGYNKFLVLCRHFTPLWITNRLADWMYQEVK